MEHESTSLELLSKYTGLSLAQMQQHPSMIINAYDTKGNNIFWNDRCADHFGKNSEAVIGKCVFDLFPGRAWEERNLMIKRGLVGQSIQVLNQDYLKKPGRYEQQVVPVKNDEGKVVAVLKMVEDI